MGIHDDDDDYGQADLPPPDWGRFAVHSRAVDTTGQSFKKVGDPTRWGAQDRATLIDTGVLVVGYEGPQLLRVQTEDVYSRQWSLVGTVQAHTALWALALTDWVMSLEVTQGVGQSRLVQNLDVRLLTNIGLTVYRPTTQPGSMETRSFAASGALIGAAVSVRVVHAIGGPLIPGGNTTVTTDVLLAPLAAGTGL